MKMMKRVLALSLVLVLAINLMPNVLLAEAATESTSPVVVFEDSFEVGEGGTFTAVTDETIPSTTADSQNYWHGAAPNDGATYYYQDWQSGGGVTVSGGVGGAYDGQSCIQLDPGDEKGQLYLFYRAGQAAKDGKFTLEDGKKYVISVWVKFDADAQMSFRFIGQNVADASNPLMDYSSTESTAAEWTRLFLPFTYSSSKNLLIGMQMLSVTSGSVYLDKLQILEAGDATGILLDQETAALEPGQSLQLTAGLNPAAATTKVVYTWASSDTNIATVDETGKVTAVADGTATITATATVWEFDYTSTVRKWVETETVWTATCEVSVESTSPIVVYEDSFEVGEGGTFTAVTDETVKTTTADGQNYWNGAEPNNSAYYNQDWQAGGVVVSGNIGNAYDGQSCTKLESVDSGRLYLGFKAKTAATAGEFALVDGEKYVASVWVKFDAESQMVFRLMVKNTGDAANPRMDLYSTAATATEWTQLFLPFTYSSAKDLVIDLEMLALSSEINGSVYLDKLQILEAEDATGIMLDQDAVALEPGQSLQLNAGLNPATATTKVEYTWASSDTDIATVDETGKVTAVADGTATIKATATVWEYYIDSTNTNTREWRVTDTAYEATCVVTVTDVSISGTSVNLGNSLAMSFYFSGNIENAAYAKLTRTYADGTVDEQTVLKENWSYDETDQEYYVSYSDIFAKHMGDKVTVGIYDSEGNRISNELTDSILTYVQRLQAHETYSQNAELMQVCQDLLIYGAAAQTVFGYDTENLVSTGTPADITIQGSTATGGDAWTGTSLLLEEEITMKVFFDSALVTQDMTAEISYTDHYGVVQTATVNGSDFAHNDGDSDWYVPVTGLVIADYQVDVTVTVKDGDTVVCTATDSIENFVYRSLAAAGNSEKAVIYKAIMALGASAYGYFH